MAEESLHESWRQRGRDSGSGCQDRWEIESWDADTTRENPPRRGGQRRMLVGLTIGQTATVEWKRRAVVSHVWKNGDPLLWRSSLSPRVPIEVSGGLSVDGRLGGESEDTYWGGIESSYRRSAASGLTREKPARMSSIVAFRQSRYRGSEKQSPRV